MFETTFLLIDKGIVGIEGMLGSGGKVTLGRPDIVGRLGSGGSVYVVGNVGCGSAGIEGIGCNVGLGKLGTKDKGGNCRSCRAASPPDAKSQGLEEAI
ncbi:hypothetical protein POTOM_053529 [Populus tomentosa]|uniref:Uncharacterized protein n=1 Tax=Populus tomentosa TaxID=118781 RepID=A0A8X7Y5Z1_POPTO|nr:hypothetical protein POTOM_053529 [Populus tomentosa]